MSFSLRLLGGIALEGDGGPVTGPAVQRNRLALLAALAVSRPRAVSRDKLMALFWPDRETEPARQLLNQAVHALRRALGAESILSVGEDLQFNPAVVTCDVVAFEEALAAGDPERAVALYAGPLLDGFFLDDAAEFERWLDRERERLAASCARAFDGLAQKAEDSGNWGKAVEWWKARAGLDRFDSRIALRLMLALERAGNRAGALQHGLMHQQALRDELEIDADAEVTALIGRLRTQTPAPAPGMRQAEGTVPAVPPAAADAEARGNVSVPRAPRSRLQVAMILLVAVMAGGALWLRADRQPPAIPSKAVDELATAVARELARRETGDSTKVRPQHRTRSIPAYELYLRGNDPALIRSDSGARRAFDYFQRAVALDSMYAVAWLGVGRMTTRIGGPWKSIATTRAQAEVAVRKALALDDSLAEAHAVLAWLRAFAYDFGAARQHFDRALALGPASAWLHERMSGFYQGTGRPVEALAEAERAKALDPLSPSATAEVARGLLMLNRCDEALALLESIKALDPPLLRSAPIAAHCYATKRMWSQAVAQLERQAMGNNATLAQLGFILGRAGNRDSALAIQARLEKRWRQGDIGAINLAFVSSGLGDRDQALTWLERAFADKSLGYEPGTSMGIFDPSFIDFRSDPRFAELLRRLGLQSR